MHSKIYDYFLHAAFTSDLSFLPDGSDEISNRITSAIAKSRNYDEFMENVTTRRLTRARINRAIMHLILNIDTDLVSDIRKYLPLYARVLGLSKNGQGAIGRIVNYSKSQW